MMTRRRQISIDYIDHATTDTRITSWQLVPCEALLELGHIMCFLRAHLVFDLGPLRLVVENCLLGGSSVLVAAS